MKNIFLIIIMLLPVLLSGQKVQGGEILGRPTDKSMLVRLIFAENAVVYAEFGTVLSNLNEKTAVMTAQAYQPVQLDFTNLNPDTRYYYRICHKLPGSETVVKRAVRSFHTQRKPGSSFTFVIQADPHLDEQSDTTLYRRCLTNQMDDKPDFIIDLGDIIMTDKLKNTAGKITRDTIARRCQYLRSFYETSCHSSPLFMVLGNHEGENGWTQNGNSENSAIYSALERKKYFANPQPDNFYSGDDTEHAFVGKRENYYAWTWGDVLFIVLDPYWYTAPKPDANTGWRWTLGKKQYDWLRKTLEGSQASFKLVFCHQLVGGDPLGRGGTEFADLYEWGGKNKDGTPGFSTNRSGWYKPIKDLLTENKVNAFFHGHDHFFGKQEKDCLIYQECPQPSHPSYQNANQADDYGYLSGQILPNSGHLRLTVQPEEIKVEYVRAYLPAVENSTRKNKDVSATYFLKMGSCYDTLASSTPVLWNSNYTNELIYPNPFAQTTRITFDVRNPAPVDLFITDINGKPVKLLLAQQFISSGSYDVMWDGRDHSGSPLPAGTYYYNIRSRFGSESGQIILIR
jgi:hypothetical protein